MRDLTLATLAVTAITGAAFAETLKMATIAPSLGQAITMATFANIVTGKLDGVEIEVSGGGAATLHMWHAALALAASLRPTARIPTKHNMDPVIKTGIHARPDAGWFK